MDNLEKSVNELFDYATTTRGMILNQTIMLERAIDEYLCLHFCQTKIKRTELMDLIFGTERMSFDIKRNIFKILSNRYHTDFIKDNPTINSDIKQIVETRNIFAHYLLDSTENGIKEFAKGTGLIGFIKFNNKRVIKQYNVKGIANHLQMIDSYIEKLISLNLSIQKALN
jgi:hypothetical protein